MEDILIVLLRQSLKCGSLLAIPREGGWQMPRSSQFQVLFFNLSIALSSAIFAVGPSAMALPKSLPSSEPVTLTIIHCSSVYNRSE